MSTLTPLHAILAYLCIVAISKSAAYFVSEGLTPGTFSPDTQQWINRREDRQDNLFSGAERFIESSRNRRDVNHGENMSKRTEYAIPDDDIYAKIKREIIEEEEVKNAQRREDVDLVTTPKEEQWIPQGSETEPDLFDTTKNDTDDLEARSISDANAQALIDTQNGRGARGATKDQWIKLPFLARPLQNDQLSSSSSNIEDANHRMPRVNFVTQGKGLQTAESRSLRESVPRGSFGRSDLRTDIYPPEQEKRGRSLDYHSRRNHYYPDDYRRPVYDDYAYYDEPYTANSRRDPYYHDRYDYKNGRRYDYNDHGRYREPYDRYDRYDGYESSNTYEKPRRIIYYANLPDVVRTPPNVYRYSANPYSRYDDDRYYNRDRYNDYRGGGSSYSYSRYPYSPLKKAENEGPRDLNTSGSNKDKLDNLKRQQEQNRKANEDAGRGRENSLNSHQYHAGASSNVEENSKSPHQTLYHDITRMDSDFHRYDHPSFQAAVDDPYVSRHD